MMTLYPPEQGAQQMCLCLTEVVTDAWKSIYVRAECKPNPLPLAWKSAGDGRSGGWIVCEVPNSGTIVRGGFASCQVSSHHAISDDLDRMVPNGLLVVMASPLASPLYETSSGFGNAFIG